jgi:hypothetical protein
VRLGGQNLSDVETLGATKAINTDRTGARALIRHFYTDYEEKFLSEVWDDEYLYSSLKGSTHVAVDEFLQARRPPGPR